MRRSLAGGGVEDANGSVTAAGKYVPTVRGETGGLDLVGMAVESPLLPERGERREYGTVRERARFARRSLDSEEQRQGWGCQRARWRSLR